MQAARRKLGEVCAVRRGTVITEKACTPGNIPVVAGGISNSYSHDTCNRPGNVVTISASGANAGYVNFWASPIFASDCTTVETENDQVSIRYVYHWLKFRQDFIQRSLRQGAAQPHVYAKDLAELEVPIPPLQEQQRIAAILDKADEIRKKRELAISKLDQLSQSVFVELFEAEGAAFPDASLTDFFRFRTGKLDSNAAIVEGRYPFFTCSKEDSWIDEFAFDEEALLLAGNNATADYSVKHFSGKFNAYQRTYVITLQDARGSYLFAKMALQRMLRRLKFASKGSGTKYLTMGIFSSMKIAVPPLDLQKQFDARMTAIAAQKKRLEVSLSLQSKLTISLICELMVA